MVLSCGTSDRAGAALTVGGGGRAHRLGIYSNWATGNSSRGKGLRASRRKRSRLSKHPLAALIELRDMLANVALDCLSAAIHGQWLLAETAACGGNWPSGYWPLLRWRHRQWSGRWGGEWWCARQEANEHARANSHRPMRDCRAPDVTPPAGTGSGICTSAHAAPVLIYPLGTFRTKHGAPPRNLFFVVELPSECGTYVWITVAVPGGCDGYEHPSHHPRCLGRSWWRLLRPRTLLLSPAVECASRGIRCTVVAEGLLGQSLSGWLLSPRWSA